jgi:dTDP-4-dehydrorhamnose reductase
MGKMLVIGAKGMLGRDLVDVLRSSRHLEVLGWDIDEIDIRNRDETIARIERLGPEIVINLAAYTDVDGCESDEERAFAVNAEGAKHVALGASRCRAKVIYLSTDYVFDGKKGRPYQEEDPPRPINVYGRSKWRGEQYVQELVEKWLIIRTQWLYGRHGRNFVYAVLRQAREGKGLSVVDDQFGSPTYTLDLAKAISLLMEREAGGLFHAVNSGHCSWYDFGQAILELSETKGVEIAPITSRELKRPAPRPSYSVLDTQKLKGATGMTLRPWLEALKDFLSEGHLPESS